MRFGTNLLLGMLCVTAIAVMAPATLAPPPVLRAAPGDQATAQGDEITLRVAALAAAFGAIADRAADGAWQAADQAYNDATIALDTQRPPIEAARGQPATAAFGRIETLLPEIDAALSAEDTAQVRAAVAAVQAALEPLAPGLAVTEVPQDATVIVLAWRDALDQIEALGAAGQWVEMRNAAIALGDEIERQAPSVARDGGPATAAPLDRARIFVKRVFAASLDQSPSDAATAIAFSRAALSELLVALGALPGATPTPAITAASRFRAFQVHGQPGAVVVVPVLAEALPRIGLGGYSVRAGWSPAALRLVDVAWDGGQGLMRRDDAAGRVDLSLPQAPTGPTGDAVLAQLRFEITGRPVDPRDYLPADEVAAIEDALDGALDKVRLGSVPQAATDLTRAYADYVAGRDRAGSLFASLATAGLAEPLAERLLLAVDLTSQNAETDRIVVTLGELKALLDTSIDAHFKRLAGETDIPVVLDVLDATDTLGAALPVAESVSGGVILDGSAGGATAAPSGSLDGPTVPPEIATAAGRATLPAAVVTGTIPASGGERAAGAESPPGAGSGTSTGGVPMVLVVVLGLAFALGAGAMAWSARRNTTD